MKIDINRPLNLFRNPTAVDNCCVDTVRTVILFLYMMCVSPLLIAASHHPEDFLQHIQGQPDEGQQIVAHFCSNCHAAKPLINIGAPRIGDDGDWELRMAQGLKVLFQHTAEGYHAMPPRGGCFECSDEQLNKAIRVLLPQHMPR